MTSSSETPEIDLREFDFSADDADARHPEPAVVEGPKPEFSWIGFGGGVAALAWVVGALMAPIGYLGVAGVAALHPALHIALATLVFGPAVLIWLGASAAAEASRTRKIAARLDAKAQAVPAQPALSLAEEIPPLKASVVLRDEIQALNDAVETAVNRLGAIETAAARNIGAFENAISAGGDGAGALAALLDRERAAIAGLNAELKTETEAMARQVSRQIRLIQEAAKIFKTEVSAAETTMAAQAETFGDIADLMGERTAAFVGAAEAAGAASSKLDDGLTAALDALAQASSLNDAARQNAEFAAHAAHAAAGAVRDATSQAVEDARRAAETVREEAAAAEDVAESAIHRLRDMAEAARAASADAQAAADRHAGVIERRLSVLADTAKAAQAAAPARTQAFAGHDTVRRAAAAGVASAVSVFPATAATRTSADWRARLSDHSELFSLDPANERGGDPFGLSGPQDPDAALVAQVIAICEEAGVRPGEWLSSADLEKIAQRARYGAASRRRAVTEAAAGGVQRLSRHLRRSAQARDVAQAFKARPDLAKVSRKGDNADVVCAYLLIETALA
jgi:hypothetical protein